MILGIAEDFTSNAILDDDLTQLPSSGLFLNSGVHPCITTENLLSFLPVLDFEIADWNNSIQYIPFEQSRKRRDLVKKNGIIYESIKVGIDKDPPNNTPIYWRITNIESLRLKMFIQKVQDRFLSDMHLTKRLVNNQFLYENARLDRPMAAQPTNFVGWTFEAKGSDYVTFRINQASIQKSGTTPIDLYVIHNNELIDTLELVPANGALNFLQMDYTFSGAGEWRFVIDSTGVYTDNGWIDSLKYDGFVCYGCVGIGTEPETATYSINNSAYGLGFNVSVYLDSAVYIDNNLMDFGACLRATFEYMAFLMMFSNSNNRINMQERNQKLGVNLEAEIKQLDADTSVKRYYDEKKRAIKVLQKTFDTQLDTNTSFDISVSSV